MLGDISPNSRSLCLLSVILINYATGKYCLMLSLVITFRQTLKPECILKQFLEYCKWGMLERAKLSYSIKIIEIKVSVCLYLKVSSVTCPQG